MFTAKCGACRNLERFGERSDRLHKTSGGESDTELNELHVRPIGAPSGPAMLTTVTPVPKQPSADRKSRGSKGSAGSQNASAISQSRDVGSDAEHELPGARGGYVPRQGVVTLRSVNVPERALHHLVVVEIFTAAGLEKRIDRTRTQSRRVGTVAPQANLFLHREHASSFGGLHGTIAVIEQNQLGRRARRRRFAESCLCGGMVGEERRR